MILQYAQFYIQVQTFKIHKNMLRLRLNLCKMYCLGQKECVSGLPANLNFFMAFLVEN